MTFWKGERSAVRNGRLSSLPSRRNDFFGQHWNEYIIELRIKKGTLYLPRKGRGDFSRPGSGG